MSQQIETQIDVTLTERNRATVFFRPILVIPFLIFCASFAPSSGDGDTFPYFVAGIILLPALLALVFRQIYPSYLLAFAEALLSLQTRLFAYSFLLTDEYPSIEKNEIVSIVFPPVDAKLLNRWLPLVKWFLAIPLYIVGIVYIFYAHFLTIFAWFSVIFTGNYPEKCAEVVVGTIAYWNRVAGYALLLVTDEYPTFSL